MAQTVFLRVHDSVDEHSSDDGDREISENLAPEFSLGSFSSSSARLITAPPVAETGAVRVHDITSRRRCSLNLERQVAATLS